MFRNPGIDAIVVLIIVLLILGPKRLPGIGKGLGQGMREFKEGITGEARDQDQDKPALSESRAMPGPGDASAPRHEPESAPASAPGSGAHGSERSS